MPGITNNKGGTRAAQLTRTTERSVQAEMKNKREVARLQLRKRMLDRELLYARHGYDRERKTATVFIKQMKQTTGISTEGRDLDGPGDRDYAKSEYARATMSEKRIKQWRHTEERLHKEIGPSLAHKSIEKEETQEERAHKLSVVLGMMGYEDKEIEKILSHIDKPIGKEDRQSIRQQNRKCKKLMDMRIKCFKSVPDVFKCLREEEMEIISRPNSGSSAKSCSSVFSLKDWEKSLCVKYMSAASVQPSTPVKPKRVRSASAIAAQYRISSDLSIARAKSASSYGLYTPRSQDSNYTPRSEEHPWAAKTVAFKEITSEIPIEKWETTDSEHANSVSLECNQIVDEIEDSTYVPDPTMVVRPQTSSGRRRVSFPVELERPKTATGERSVHDYEANTTILPPYVSSQSLVTSTSSLHADGSVVDDNAAQNGKEFDDKEVQLLSSQAISDLDKHGAMKKSTSMSSLKSISASSSTASNHSEVFDPNVKEIPEKDSSIRSSTRSLSNPRQTRSASANQKRASFSIPTPKFIMNNPELMKALRRSQNAIRERGEMTDNLSYRDSNEAFMLRRASVPANIYKKRLSFASDANEKELVTDEHGTVLPRWKRDLLRESPGSLYSPKKQVRVPRAMSKARRLRELERLKDENVNDVKKLCDDEQERRAQSRMNVFMTMVRVKQAVTTLKVKADETRSRSNTQSSADGAEQT